MNIKQIQFVLFILGVLFLQSAVKTLGSEPQVASVFKVNQDTKNASADWLDQFLAKEMNYDQMQIDQFKSTVAEMSEEQLRAMLTQIKRCRGQREREHARRLALQRKTIANLDSVKAVAYSHPTTVATYGVGTTRIRSLRSNPRAQSLFRGYSVRIRAN